MGKIRKATPRCFKCGEVIKSATKDDSDAWEIPCGVLFHGGYNYGSRVHDSTMSNKEVRIIVCDKCITRYKSRVRLVKGIW
jgi:hypothetical protein